MPQPLDSYLELLAKGADLAEGSWAPNDPLVAEELCDQVFMNLCQGYFMYLQSDSRHPDFGPLYNNVLRLQPNPDDNYQRANVAEDGVYRISGNRGTVRLLTLTLAGKTLGMAEMDKVEGQTAEYDLDEVITFGADGSFSLIMSPERPAGYTGDWLYLPPGSKSLIVRQRAYDWANEIDPRLAIERLDVSPLKPRIPVDDLRQRLTDLATFGQRHSRQWLQYQDQIRAKGIINRVEHHAFSSLGGIKVQTYWWGMFDLQPGEALILETEIPENAPYWNIQLNDQIWNTLEYSWRQSSLNGHQARLDSDGKFRAVISPEDPGVPNWLDTVEHLQGTMVGRWYRCDTNPVPQITKVKLAEVRNHLPADTPVVSQAERDDSIRARARSIQLRRRW